MNIIHQGNPNDYKGTCRKCETLVEWQRHEGRPLGMLRGTIDCPTEKCGTEIHGYPFNKETGEIDWP